MNEKPTTEADASPPDATPGGNGTIASAPADEGAAVAPPDDGGDIIEVEVVPPADDDATAGEGGEADDDAQTIAGLEAKIAELEAESKDNYDRMLRQAAELENFRRRSKRDLTDAKTAAKTGVLKEMLPVVDNLELAVKHADTAGDGDGTGVLEGVKLVLRQFAQAFERCGVAPIEAEGQPFDPNVHEAISQIETADHPPGSVAQVYQRGYTIGERLLRPSLVVVAKAPAEPAPAEPAAPTDQADEDAAETERADEG